MAGLALKPTPRRLGAIGWDQLPVYEVREPLDQVESIWDYTSEYEFLRARTDRRPKIGMPGPYGITTELDFSPVYRTRRECADALVPAIRSDIKKLVAAGCDCIQIEEPLTPSHAAEDRTPENLVETINAVVDGITGCTFIVHICFGSFRRLPYAKRTYRWLFPTLLDANVQGFSLEFGAREMAEIDLVGTLGSRPDPVRRADRHQDPLLRDARGHHRAGPRLPAAPRSRAPRDLHRLRPAPGPPLPRDQQDVRGGGGRAEAAGHRLNLRK